MSSLSLARFKAAWQQHPKFFWPLAVLTGAIVLSFLLVVNRPQLQPKERAVSYTAVRVITVDPKSIVLEVQSQGTVQPRTESELIPEVSGRIIWMSPSLVSGGYFEQGALLLKIEQADYKSTLDKNHAAVTRAEVEFETASSEYKRTLKLEKQKLASQSQFDQAQRTYRVAEANLQDAIISRQQAERDLDRTLIKAPFAGRIRAENVDLGQFVSRGSTIATIYATDYAEVRLPIANSQLAFLDLPIGFRGQLKPEQESEVTLRGDYSGSPIYWPAKLVRTEAEIDAKSRMFYAVARAKVHTWDGKNPPLIVGLFVKATIQGRTAENIVVLPRVAMRDNNHVLIVDDEDRLRFRQVELLRIERNSVLVSAGLSAGERVCISPLQVAVEGMKVKPIGSVVVDDSVIDAAPETVSEMATETVSKDTAETVAMDAGTGETAATDAAPATTLSTESASAENTEPSATVSAQPVESAAQ